MTTMNEALASLLADHCRTVSCRRLEDARRIKEIADEEHGIEARVWEHPDGHGWQITRDGRGDDDSTG